MIAPIMDIIHTREKFREMGFKQSTVYVSVE